MWNKAESEKVEIGKWERVNLRDFCARSGF
jgi:hypothetical protein